jgi:hypothetical protein
MYKRKSLSTDGFAALLLVITISISLMTTMIASGDSLWRLKTNIAELSNRTQRELAAIACRDIALLYISEDPEYIEPEAIDLGSGVQCSIISISRLSGSRVIKTSGIYKGEQITLTSQIDVTNSGLNPSFLHDSFR